MATTSRKHRHPVRTLVVFGSVVALLYAVMAVSGVYTPKLGLDLRGGTTITLTASNVTGEGTVDPTSLELARTIIQQRVDSMGVGETEVTTSGDRQIVVSVPNVQADELVSMVGQTAQLYFRKVFAEEAAPAAGEPGAEPGEDPEATVAPDPSASPTTTNRRPLPQLPTPVPSPRPTAPADPAPTLDSLLEWQPSQRDTDEFEAFTCGDDSPTPSVVDQALIACDESNTYKYLLGPALLRGDQVTRAYASVPPASESCMPSEPSSSAETRVRTICRPSRSDFSRLNPSGKPRPSSCTTTSSHRAERSARMVTDPLDTSPSKACSSAFCTSSVMTMMRAVARSASRPAARPAASAAAAARSRRSASWSGESHAMAPPCHGRAYPR